MYSLVVMISLAGCKENLSEKGLIDFEYTSTLTTEDGELVYEFEGQSPMLEIEDYLLSAKSANLVLMKLGLPMVNGPGYNVEHFEYAGGPVGNGRLWRTHFKWRNYELGELVFVRKSYGAIYPGEPSRGGERYTALQKVILTPVKGRE